MSGLLLNLPKSEIIPLWDSSLRSIHRAIADEMPEWNSVSVNSSARYLGFSVGPDRNSHMWSKALDLSLIHI
eukprot:7994920-Karenia_brevis.AAC.1